MKPEVLKMKNEKCQMTYDEISKALTRIRALLHEQCVGCLDLSSAIDQVMVRTLHSQSFLQRLLLIGDLNLAPSVASRDPET